MAVRGKDYSLECTGCYCDMVFLEVEEKVKSK